MGRSDLKAMELEAAREILAEVFKINPSEVDAMIENRLDSIILAWECRATSP